MTTFEVESILERLDMASQAGNFPPIQMEEYYNAGFRLKVFLSDDEWIVLFESIDYTETDYTFVNHLKACGNKLDDIGFIELNEIITATEEQPFFDEDNIDKFLLNPKEFEVVIKEKKQKFEFNGDDYKNAQSDLMDEDVPLPAKVLRILSTKVSDQLFSTNEEILKNLDKNPEVFTLFLDLKSWQHPDVIEMENPSEIGCFQSIAEAIAKRDAKVYNCPEELHNSHWSNWEWYKEEDDEDYL